MSLNGIMSAVDANYTRLIAFVKGNQFYDKTEDPHIAKLFYSVMDELSVRTVDGTELVILQGTRIVVPFPARKSVIHELHNAHIGTDNYSVHEHWNNLHRSHIRCCSLARLFPTD